VSIYTSPVSELHDLIEQPAEREWLELKSWVDLTDPTTRANTARHLAAISNYGGGYLVCAFRAMTDSDSGVMADSIPAA
jgi:hypothetical protein